MSEHREGGQGVSLNGTELAVAHAVWFAIGGPDGQDWLDAQRLARGALEVIEDQGYVVMSRSALDELERQTDPDYEPPYPLDATNPLSRFRCPECGLTLSCRCERPAEQISQNLGACECEFDPYEDGDDEESWHYKRTCASCGQVWWGLHCPHDGVQNPCPGCGHVPGGRPTPIERLLGRRDPRRTNG